MRRPAGVRALMVAVPKARVERYLERILQRGTFPHPQDGSVFFNREGHLPARARGHYREYTVPTPGLSHRGTRRIVTGGDPPAEWFYTADHYESFRAFDLPAVETRP